MSKLLVIIFEESAKENKKKSENKIWFKDSKIKKRYQMLYKNNNTNDYIEKLKKYTHSIDYFFNIIFFINEYKATNPMSKKAR